MERDAIVHASSAGIVQELAKGVALQNQVGYAKNFDRSRSLSSEEIAWWVEEIRSRAGLDRSSRVLDGGCGTGRFAVPLEAAVGCSVVGLDKNREMLREARGKSEAVQWIEGDLLRLEVDLPEHVGTFDCILISSVIQQIQNLDLLFRQCRKMLVEGGVLLVRTTTPKLLRSVEWYRYFQKALDFELRRTHSVHSVRKSLNSSGFRINSQIQADLASAVIADELVVRFARKGFSWCSVYTEAEYSNSLESMRRAYAKKERVEYHHPTILITAKASA